MDGFTVPLVFSFYIPFLWSRCASTGTATKASSLESVFFALLL